jgi:hypothetical protein
VERGPLAGKLKNLIVEITELEKQQFPESELGGSRDVRVELRSSSRIAFVEIGDPIDDVSDRLFGIGDLQRPRGIDDLAGALRINNATLPIRFERRVDTRLFLW